MILLIKLGVLRYLSLNYSNKISCRLVIDNLSLKRDKPLDFILDF